MNFNLLDYPMALRDPRHLPAQGAWVGHIPFAFALVEMMRPENIVGLGVFQGSSYCAFCQAVAELGLRSSRCFGIDTWRGDVEGGQVDEAVLAQLRQHHDPLYSQFSQFVQAEFDTAAAHVAEGAVDLLHVDGTHAYESVRHVFEIWLPKMSERGVMLFHDTQLRENDYGVWRLWEELSGRYPSFEFEHSNGLGVLAVGTHVQPEVTKFMQAASAEPQRMRRLFTMLAERIENERLLRHMGQFLNATQNYLDAWKGRAGQNVDDVLIDANLNPLDAIERVARSLRQVAKTVQPAETTPQESS